MKGLISRRPSLMNTFTGRIVAGVFVFFSKKEKKLVLKNPLHLTSVPENNLLLRIPVLILLDHLGYFGEKAPW